MANGDDRHSGDGESASLSDSVMMDLLSWAASTSDPRQRALFTAIFLRACEILETDSCDTFHHAMEGLQKIDAIAASAGSSPLIVREALECMLKVAGDRFKPLRNAILRAINELEEGELPSALPSQSLGDESLSDEHRELARDWMEHLLELCGMVELDENQETICETIFNRAIEIIEGTEGDWSPPRAAGQTMFAMVAAASRSPLPKMRNMFRLAGPTSRFGIGAVILAAEEFMHGEISPSAQTDE